MASGLRCAKAARMTRCHSLLLRGEKGHGTTTGQHTAVTRVAQGGTKRQEGQGAPGGNAAAPSLPETSTHRISASLQPSDCVTLQLWLTGRSWFVLVGRVTAVLLPLLHRVTVLGPHGLLCHHGLASHLKQRPTGLTRDRHGECQAGELPSASNPAPQGPQRGGLSHGVMPGSPPSMAVFRLGACGGVIAEMGTGGPGMAGQVPRALQVPKPCPKPGGLRCWHWAGNGGPGPTAQLSVPRLGGQHKGQRLQSPNHTHSTGKVKRKSRLQHQQQLALEVMIISQQHYTPRQAQRAARGVESG